MDADRCEGRAGTVGQRGAERVLDPTAGETRGHAPAPRGTRRWLVRLVGSLSLGGVLAVVGAEASAAERPHERLGQRTPQRNRRQRNDNDNDKNQNNKNNTNDGGSGGNTSGLGAVRDADGDGLADATERDLGTDPLDPDTDDDGLEGRDRDRARHRSV